MTPIKEIPGLLFAAALVAAGFVVVLVVGFRLHGQVPPAPLGALFYPAIGLFTAMAVLLKPNLVRALSTRPPGSIFPWVRAREQRLKLDTFEAELAARVAALAADPVGRQYAERLRRGEAWSDDQIAYDQDRTRLVTCVHLQPIEQAMRGRGLYLKLLAPTFVEAQCRVDQEALAADFPDPVIGYREWFESDRGGADDFPFARVGCSACAASAIDVIHSLVARDEVVWFPRAPGP
ncbi:hypothetical protein BH11PSE2_BH11PSE2_18940 [soil metagenome]